VQFLNVLDADEQMSKQLYVILWPMAIKIVTGEVDIKMKAVKNIFGMLLNDCHPQTTPFMWSCCFADSAVMRSYSVATMHPFVSYADSTSCTGEQEAEDQDSKCCVYSVDRIAV